MPPKVKFQKGEIVNAALNVARKKGIDAVTAREVAAELRVSPGPIFTWFDTMEQLRAEVYRLAMSLYRDYIERGLSGPIPFLGVWRQYLHFAKDEPELYRLLFLTRPGSAFGGAMDALRFSQDLARESLMRTYNMDARTADCYFRDMWLVAFSFATLVVTGDCPYTEEEMLAVGAEISLSICKAYKEIPGLPEGKFDKNAIFRELVAKRMVPPVEGSVPLRGKDLMPFAGETESG